MKRKSKVRKHTPEQIEQFWKLLSEGWSYREIEKKIHVKYWTLHDWRQFKTQVAVNMRLANRYGLYGRVADGKVKRA